MFSRPSLFVQLAVVFGVASAVPSYTTGAPSLPTVTLDRATVVGSTNGSVTSFMGIPFAEPPVGDLRLRLPKPVSGYTGTINATQPATQCIQLVPPIRTDMPAEMLKDVEIFLGSSVLNSPVPQGEDCLTVTVQVPAGTKPGDKLPVIAFIFGGGFTTGSTVQMPGDAHQ